MFRIGRLSPWTVALCAAAALLLPAPARAQAQGIEVHGHWVIEVRDPDGSLQVRREFENALNAGGQQTLADLLGRVETMGLWQVGVGTEGAGGVVVFLILEPASSASSSPGVSKNLTVSSDTESVVLQGSFVSTVDTEVKSVNTSVELSTGSPGFTSAGISPAVPIQASQTVSVAVTLTFS